MGASSKNGSLGTLHENSCFDSFRQYDSKYPMPKFQYDIGSLSGNYSIIKMGQNASSTNGTCNDPYQMHLLQLLIHIQVY